MRLVLKKELEGAILDVGGGGEGVIGRIYGPRVVAIDNRQEELDEAVAAGITEPWALAEHFGVDEDFLKKAVCLYTYGNLAAELYF